MGPSEAEQEIHGGFARARREEFFGRLVRRLATGLRGGGSNEDVAGRLACFGEARELSGSFKECCRGFEIVEVGRISGSVGRCMDFDRGFLPVCSCLGDRWRSVDRALREGNHCRRWSYTNSAGSTTCSTATTASRSHATKGSWRWTQW